MLSVIKAYGMSSPRTNCLFQQGTMTCYQRLKTGSSRKAALTGGGPHKGGKHKFA